AIVGGGGARVRGVLSRRPPRSPGRRRRDRDLRIALDARGPAARAGGNGFRVGGVTTVRGAGPAVARGPVPDRGDSARAGAQPPVGGGRHPRRLAREPDPREVLRAGARDPYARGRRPPLGARPARRRRDPRRGPGRAVQQRRVSVSPLHVARVAALDRCPGPGGRPVAAGWFRLKPEATRAATGAATRVVSA